MAVFAVALALAAPASLAQTRFDDLRPERRYDADVVSAIQKGEARPLEKLAIARTEPDTSGFDVRKYTIRCAVDFGNRTISARTTIDAASTSAGLSSIDLDFVGFGIASVTVDGASADYVRSGGRILRVALPRAFAPGETFAIDVTYSGVPPIENGLGFGFSANGAATFAEPEGARLWYPCKDRPSDKAQYEGFVTVPSSYVVASNGRLVDVTDADFDRKTYHWLETHQISTYLIDFAISDYAVVEDSLGDLPINHYVYPRLLSAARRDFSRTPDMIEAFQTRLGVAYPFDKYGHALFENFGGAMEHQSCTSYGASLITGDNRYDRVVAHELGHQWFGDLVSPAEWEEIWLNEGFATWTEFLWTEQSDPSFLPTLMAGRESSYFSYESQAGPFPIYAPPPSRLFSTPIYQKGGWVVAMLRYVVGDEAFFAGLRAYLTEHAYENARSTDLRAAMEVASGKDLSAFFDEWVYGTGYPKYESAWTARAVPGGTFQVDLRIRQTQTVPTVFTIPLEVEAVAADGTRVRQRVAVPSNDTVTSLCFDFQPTRVTVDPDNRVLGTVTPTGDSVAAQPLACGEAPPEIVVSSVVWRSGSLLVTGAGFVVGDSVVEVDGTELAKTKYPKGDRNPDGTTTSLLGKQRRLKNLVPSGSTVQITVLNRSTGLRSAPFGFTR